MEKNIRDKILKLMKEQNVSYGELSKRTGLSKSTLQRYVTNPDIKVPIDRISLIAIGLHTTPAYLMGWSKHKHEIVKDAYIYKDSQISFIKVPLYGDISCGKGSFVDDNIIDYVAVPDDNLNQNGEYFAQYAKGDSMKNAGIDDGDIIVFEKTIVLEDNKIGCFCIDEGVATCKKFKKGPSYIQLIPANPDYDPIVIDLENTNFRIVGKLRKVIKDYE